MFKENYVINGIIFCETGLHIGDSKDAIDIGGSDSPIVRDSITRYPYIPGSSIKGKLRSLIELSDEKSSKSVISNHKNNHDNVSTDEDSIAVKLFGLSPNDISKLDETKFTYQTRTIIRDAHPTEDTKNKWDSNDELFDGSELKWENTINRITSIANPRNIERVPKGSEFNFEIIFSVYSGDNSKNILKLLEAMKLLEFNYLGGSGSRGFGQVKFKDISIVQRELNYYISDNPENLITKNSNIDEAINEIKSNFIRVETNNIDLIKNNHNVNNN